MAYLLLQPDLRGDGLFSTLVVKAQSDACFKLLERQPKLRAVLTLGNHLVWVTSTGTALVFDLGNGNDKLSDDENHKLFVAKKWN